MNNDQFEKIVSEGASTFGTKYGHLFEKVEAESPIGRAGLFDTYQQFVLGKQIYQTEEYLKYYMGETGGTGELGVLPNVVQDLITMQYTTSILPFIASTQTLDDEQGTVYFKTIEAKTTKGNLTAGQQIVSPLAPAADNHGFASEMSSTKVADTDGTTAAFTLGAGIAHIRPNSVRIVVSNDAAMYAIDDGQGNLQGPGIAGTVNYVTGEVNVYCTTAPAASGEINMAYGLDYAEGAEIPEISRVLKSKRVIARIFALKSQISLFQNYAYNKRFGGNNEAEMISDLAQLLNAELANNMLQIAMTATPAANKISWEATNPNLNATDRAVELKQNLAVLDALISESLGYGSCGWYACDTRASIWLKLIPGFESIISNVEYGPAHIGYLDGKPVIQSPFMPQRTILGGFKGSSPFSSALVYAPFMPAITTSAIPGTNEVTQKGLAASWSHMGTLLNTSIDPYAECNGLAQLTITES